MKVTLISSTPNAMDLLIFTKSTRLSLSPGLLDEIKNWPEEKKLDELKYMANTIPSSWEFVDYTFLIESVSRAFTHQFVRTRQASYAQQTMRVLPMCDYEYIKTERLQESEEGSKVIDQVNSAIKAGYNKLLGMGFPAEDARGILPTNISTNIIAKFNLRTLSDLAKSRSGGRTQNEYQQVMRAMVNSVLEVHPWADLFLFGSHDRNYFDEIEAFAKREFPNDLLKKGELLKIVDKMRKG